MGQTKSAFGSRKVKRVLLWRIRKATQKKTAPAPTWDSDGLATQQRMTLEFQLVSGTYLPQPHGAAAGAPQPLHAGAAGAPQPHPPAEVPPSQHGLMISSTKRGTILQT